MSDLCQRCGFAPKEGCRGTGTVIQNIGTDAENVDTCPNHLRRLRIENVKSRLTPDLLKARIILESPIFTPSKISNQPPEKDLTKSNIRIQGVTWSGFLPHLRVAMTCCCARDPKFTYKVVDDRRLKDVFVGGESWRNRTEQQRASKENNNIIADLMGEDQDLVIMRLGFLRYKNVAAASVLLEALMLREAAGKSTWLFESTDPFESWEHSKDSTIELYVDEKYKTVRLQASAADEPEEGLIVVDEDTTDNRLTEQPDFNRAPEHDEPEPPSGGDFDLPGAGRPKKFKKKWGR